MRKQNMKRTLVLLAHAFVVWGLCAAVMGIGMPILGSETTLIIHAIAAPVFAIAVSSIYYWTFNYTTPLQTAAVFLFFVIFMDVFLVAMIILKSFDMFKSFVGTWFPFILIFTATYITGIVWRKAQVSRGQVR